jgi:hypothetical protein
MRGYKTGKVKLKTNPGFVICDKILYSALGLRLQVRAAVPESKQTK